VFINEALVVDNNRLTRIVLFLCAITVVNPSSALELNAKFYGELNVAYDNVSDGDSDFQNWVSRVGVKGKAPLGESMSIIYQIEQEVDPIHGGLNAEDLFSMRNTFVGLETNLGKFLFGTHDTPMKRSQGKADFFNDQAGDVKKLIAGEVRAKESFFYHSPAISGFKFQAAYVPKDDLNDASTSFSATYTTEDLYVAFANDSKMRKNDVSLAKTKVFDSQRLSLVYALGSFQISGIAQQSKRLDQGPADRESGFSMGISYKYSQYKILTQYGRSDILKPDAKSWHLGIERKLAKTAKAYLYHWDYDQSSNSRTTSLGIEYKF